jgi:hypothetical protein
VKDFGALFEQEELGGADRPFAVKDGSMSDRNTPATLILLFATLIALPTSALENAN